MEQVIQHNYQRFIKTVSEGRNLTLQDVEKIAQGRVWAGEQLVRIFVRKIQSEANRSELKKFFAGALCPRWYWPFRASGVITECKKLRIKDASSVEYHGLVEIQPEHVALRAAIVLNGRQLGGRVVEVRKWYDRSRARDKRGPANLTPTDLPTDLLFSDRRGRDRRRSSLTIEMI